MTGGFGADIFRFGTADFGHDAISDWQDGADRINLKGSGATSFGDLEVTNVGANAIIVVANGSIDVTGGGGVLDAGDIIF